MNAIKYFTKYLLLMIFLVACSKDTGLRSFSSDGCSLFPDSSVFSDKDWCSCCFERDIAYWRGGTSDERLVADQQLKACILQETQNFWLAALMYRGGRAGGSPYVYSWFRRGYGCFGRNYQSLTDKEHALADSPLEDYFAGAAEKVCEK